MKYFILSAALALPLPALASVTGPLTTADTLAAAQHETPAPLVLDIRTGTTEDGKSVYDAGHIPGAIHAPYNLFRGPQDNPGELVPEDRLTEILRGLGVTHDRTTVIVHQGADATDFGAAARVYWTLKSSGVSTLAILNGGMNAWQAAGLAQSQAVVTPEPSDITVEFDDTWLATTETVQSIVEGSESAELIDARPEAFWKGEAKHGAAARPGTLPQSRYFEHSRWFDTDAPALIQPALVDSLAAENGFTQGDALVSFCNTGHWAATNWFALSELAGIDGVKLYPESLVGWSNAGLPMDNVPGIFRNLMNKIRGNY
ncbi:thiosulfate/3-mercaptopyruvate sulfurtransferase [Rhodovulum imhoffii]|uniref:Thiosulfate/3-mercaptopyruvate sulfurtransferase n=1 Tax=Rhodovulum imhoffii TaxID=365340 RepID=A0A2T5BNK1_9RHOB|nr:rhodanese-like domain-containing protein [Rhodovulum imhoffii]MBK5934605.1 sulfurtransferase [Rhodovulum imhoffii]PTN00566.1 thiosulfate/3-mercaptopyruvate sulfurtransferase [Rhodovulum imhoffii]